MPLFASEELDIFLAEFGEDVTFTHGSTNTPVRAAFDEGKVLGMGADTGEDADEVFRKGLANYTVIYLGQHEVENRPVYRDKVTRADGSVYTIQQTKPEDGLWKCWASSDERMDF